MHKPTDAELLAAFTSCGKFIDGLHAVFQLAAPSTSQPLTEDYITADRNEWREKAERNHLIMAAWRDRYETLRAELDALQAAHGIALPPLAK